MKKFLTAIACLSILVSCKKEGQPYPSMLISSTYHVTSYPKVYTKFGEITDPAVVDAYVKEPSPSYFFLTADTIIAAPPDTITFQTGDTVLFSLLPQVWGTRIMKQQGQLIYFYMTDTLVGNKPAESPISDIEKEIGTFKRYERNVCFNTGICMYQEVYDAFIATGTRQQLEFPLLTYKITRATNSSYSGTMKSNYNNLFNTPVLNLLQDRDTLAVQTLKRVYSN